MKRKIYITDEDCTAIAKKQFLIFMVTLVIYVIAI